MANIATYEEEKPLSEKEKEVILGIADEMVKSTAIPCTACHYCTSHCPQGIDIPKLLALYNQMLVTGDYDFISRMDIAAMPEEKHPKSCIGGGSCQAVCPQTIHIPEALIDFARRLGE